MGESRAMIDGYRRNQRQSREVASFKVWSCTGINEQLDLPLIRRGQAERSELEGVPSERRYWMEQEARLQGAPSKLWAAPGKYG